MSAGSEPKPSANPDAEATADNSRAKYIFYFAFAALVVAFLAFGVAIWAFHGSTSPNPTEIIPAVLGPLMTLIGTLAGYVAGQQAGAAGTANAQSQTASAQKQATRAQRRETIIAGMAEPQVVAQVFDKYPELFTSGT
jgi:hypothetical protein